MSLLDSIDSINNYNSEINLHEIDDLISEIEDFKKKEKKFYNDLLIGCLISIDGLNYEDIDYKNKELVIFNQYYFTNKNIYYEYLNLFHYYLIILINI